MVILGSKTVILTLYGHIWTGMDHSGPFRPILTIMAIISYPRRGSEGRYPGYGPLLGPSRTLLHGIGQDPSIQWVTTIPFQTTTILSDSNDSGPEFMDLRCGSQDPIDRSIDSKVKHSDFDPFEVSIWSHFGTLWVL